MIAAPAWAQIGESCGTLTDKAMTADLKAATAQSRKDDLDTQARLYEEVVGLWSQAAGVCEGRARDRAQRNLADSQRVQAALSDQLGAGPQCAAAHRDAGALQDLGRQALADRRWTEASMLFRKAENTWDLASERCTGTQQEVANKRREQSGIDGHNAEYCAPLFERAREQTQRLRALATGTSRDDKQDASQVAETSWREAMGRCKGSVVDLARTNAQAIARERGTPWVARTAPASSPANGSAARAGLPAAMPAATAAPIPGAVTPANGPAAAAAAPSADRPAEPVAQPAEFSTGSTRFSGQFVRDADGFTYSGTGRLAWANGDVFDGTLIKGQRHGNGQMVWANGQRYSGDWVDDQPVGQGRLQFANGNVYEGRVASGLPEGEGRMRYASGDSYTGQLQRGVPQGRGVYTWKGGQQFEGQWRSGQPEGQGKLIFANGNQYEGTIRGGVPHGNGKLKFVGGNQYEGEVADGSPHGKGRMVFASGDVYLGFFTRGEPDGEGTYTWVNGDAYVGHWKSGKKHGQGTLSWKNGERWTGLYEDDEQVEAAEAPADPKTRK